MLRQRRSRRADAPPAAGARLRPSRHVLTAETDGVAVLLDLGREVYLGLDEVGTGIWREIEAGASVAEITERLAHVYDAPADVLRGEAERFVAELQARSLVVAS